MYAQGLRCLVCGYESALDAAFLCPRCGGNQEVFYDFEALRGTAWRPESMATGRPDIWRYASLLPVRHLDNAPSVRVGGTPLYRVPRLAAHLGLKNVWLKDDGLNPSASFKDRASAVVAARALETGAPTLAGASTGNAGSSMACMAAATGQRAVIFVPKAAPQAKIAQLLTFGATVVAVDGTYDDAFALCQQVCEQRGWLNRNTGTNPFTREGKKTCSMEICEQLGWEAPDRIVVSVGDGNILTGLWKGLRDCFDAGWIDRMPKLVAAQSERSNAIALAVEALRAEGVTADSLDPKSVRVAPVSATTVADSISVDAPADGVAAVRAIIETDGDVVQVPDEAILEHIGIVARLGGVFGEPAGVTSVAGLAALAAAGKVAPDERVVCVVTGNGLKDVGAAMKVAGEPITIPPTVEAFDSAYDAD